MFRSLLRSAAVVASLTLVTAPAWAVPQPINDCDDICTGDCELTKDLLCCQSGCDGTGPIQVRNGADIDLHGHSIKCGGTGIFPNNGVCYNSTNSAIDIQANGSVVKNTQTTESRIWGEHNVGYWIYAVTCNSKSLSKVSGIKVQNTQLAGLLNCAQVENNAIIAPEHSGGPAVQTSGVADSDFISSNYIDGYYYGIKVTGIKGVSVDHNIIYTALFDGSSEYGIDVSGASGAGASLDVTSNMVMGLVGTPIVGNASNDFVDNYCHVDNPSCAACGTSGYCEQYKAPIPGF
jgi:hypothetical protein